MIRIDKNSYKLSKEEYNALQEITRKSKSNRWFQIVSDENGLDAVFDTELCTALGMADAILLLADSLTELDDYSLSDSSKNILVNLFEQARIFADYDFTKVYVVERDSSADEFSQSHKTFVYASEYDALESFSALVEVEKKENWGGVFGEDGSIDEGYEIEESPNSFAIFESGNQHINHCYITISEKEIIQSDVSSLQIKCPFGGDETNDCEDCAYSIDYHYVDGNCVRRPNA